MGSLISYIKKVIVVLINILNYDLYRLIIDVSLKDLLFKTAKKACFCMYKKSDAASPYIGKIKLHEVA